MSEQGKEILRYADAAMFDAQPILREEGDLRITPKVFLLSATPDPLGANAAGFRMYAGKPTYDLGTITDDERRDYWRESLNTHLAAPWEFISLHFFIEAVTRSFTHQMVRQRTATYAQESMRFAVKHGVAGEAALPPSIMSHDEAVDLAAGPMHPPDGARASFVWHRTLNQIQNAYEELIGLGIPAEDARGLLPHCTTTRLHYYTNFRNLVDTMGNRLCTQAQFEWRAVALGIMKAIRDHASTYYHPHDMLGQHPRDGSWQWEALARPMAKTFTPVCYKAGKCVFMGKLDRGCTIRDRVNDGRFDLIEPEEWMADPMAGLTTEDNRPG